ncbi:AI-2E family transporter [Shouchella lonarensis]|uniref:Predicted PurR-regulated permease PerM n=1 Tax=Shouchella lonarensis TaxID=1464122 RepID=A0A1G6MZJ0_9BACI|nr:AI-2E family transporter [Shouchella lonarensis]SDC60983.1 Predicted PurR-regulated permease PerM [Shouchella lonarensis]
MMESRLFRFACWIIVIFLIIYLGSLVNFIFKPLAVLVQTLFAPIVIALVIYYLLRPFVNLLNKKIPRGLSILIVFLALIGVITSAILYIVPIIQAQILDFIDNAPRYGKVVQQFAMDLQQQPAVQNLLHSSDLSIDNISETFSDNLQGYIESFLASIGAFIGAIANIIIVAVIIPFVLFYMLKEGKKAPLMILNLFPRREQEEGKKVLADLDKALSSYIQGQILVSACVGTLCLIWYLIIGLDYALVLAVVALFTNVIPFLGPWIGTAPAVIVALFHEPFTAVLVIIGVVVIQQVESNIFSPQIMGRQLSVHPITIIFVLLVASQLAGFVGILLAVPTYAVGKVIVQHTYRLIRIRMRTSHTPPVKS